MVVALGGIDRAQGGERALRTQHPEALKTLREIARVQSVESSNAIEQITAPSQRIRALVSEQTAPANRSEEEISGYRAALDTIHSSAEHIPFKPSVVEQFHRDLYQFTNTPAGRWKSVENSIEEVTPAGVKVLRFQTITAIETPAAMGELHDRFAVALDSGAHHPLLLARLWTESSLAQARVSQPLWSPVQVTCGQSSTGVHTSGTRIRRSYSCNVGTQPHLEVRRAMRPRVSRVPQIVALGGGGFSMEQGNPLLDDYVLSLTGAKRPRVCFLPTASGDADHYVVRFYRRFSPGCEASHVSLFRRDQGTGGVEDDLATHLLAQDLIYVGGGNVVSMLGAWRAHGLDSVLRQAWRKGVVLCGPSAGSLCWFAESLSAFHGAPRRVSGLGLLPYSNCVHYDAEPARRAEYHRFVGDGMRPGYAAEDGVALHFRRTHLERVVSSRPDGCAYRVEPAADGVLETPLETVYLGAADAGVATSGSAKATYEGQYYEGEDSEDQAAKAAAAAARDSDRGRVSPPGGPGPARL